MARLRALAAIPWPAPGRWPSPGELNAALRRSRSLGDPVARRRAARPCGQVGAALRGYCPRPLRASAAAGWALGTPAKCHRLPGGERCGEKLLAGEFGSKRERANSAFSCY